MVDDQIKKMDDEGLELGKLDFEPFFSQDKKVNTEELEEKNDGEAKHKSNSGFLHKISPIGIAIGALAMFFVFLLIIVCVFCPCHGKSREEDSEKP